MTAPTPDLREALTAALPYWITDRLEDSQVRGVVDIVLAVLQPALASERERCALAAGETLARLLAPASYERAVKDAIRALPPLAPADPWRLEEERLEAALAKARRALQAVENWSRDGMAPIAPTLEIVRNALRDPGIRHLARYEPTNPQEEYPCAGSSAPSS